MANRTKRVGCALVAAAGSISLLGSPDEARADPLAPPVPEPVQTAPETAPPDATREPEAQAAGTPVAPSATTPRFEAKPTPPASAPGPWRYTAMLGVLSAPRPLALQPMGRYRRASDPRWDLFALGAAIEYLPPGIASFGGPKLSWMQLAAEGRWFPWRMLFVAGRAGWQYTRADSVKYGSDVTYVSSAVVLGASIGALHSFGSGLTLGGDVGFTAPIAPRTRLDSDGQEDSGARKVANTFGLFVMPSVALRAGYTF